MLEGLHVVVKSDAMPNAAGAVDASPTCFCFCVCFCLSALAVGDAGGRPPTAGGAVDVKDDTLTGVAAELNGEGDAREKCATPSPPL